MACHAAGFHERACLLCRFNCVSNPKIKTMIQEIIAFAILAFAVVFLIKKFFWKSKKKKDCGDGNCGCS
ncbi:FeoB-associated Cys-rich membrane protein [Flavobacterium sp. ENC]